MKTLIWLTAIFAISAFIFSATVNAANSLANKLELKANSQQIEVQSIINR